VLELLQPLVLALMVGRVPICSAGIVSIDGPLVLTAAHCLKGEGHVGVGGLPGTVVASYPELDVALMRPLRPGRVAQALEIRRHPPKADEQVFVVGYPLGLGPVLLRGRALGCSELRCLFDLGAAQGLSGAPIVDKRGRIVGMLIGYQGLLVVGVSPQVLATVVKAYR
jgi:S1-C subfamily serine protease